MPYTTNEARKDNVSFSGILDALKEDRLNTQTDKTLRLNREADGSMNLKQHTGFSRFFGGDAVKQDRAQKEQGAAELIAKGLDNELGPGAGKELLQQAGVVDNKITGPKLEVLERLHEERLREIQTRVATPERDTVAKWRNAADNGQPGPPKAAQGSMQELLNNPNITWKVSESGSGGALIGITGDRQGVIIKIEGLEGAEKATALSETMNRAFPNGSAFEVAHVTNETQNQAGLTALKTKLEALKDTARDPLVKQTLEKHLNNLNNADGFGVSKMGFVAGEQLNKLSMDDRVAMLQSGGLAKELGKAAVVCPMAGLKDHAAPCNDYLALPTNMSNFMVDGNTGKLAPIDFDTDPVGLAPGTNNMVYGVRNSASGVESLSTFVAQATASQEAFDQAVTAMVRDCADGHQRTPLSNVMQALANPDAPMEGLFTPNEGKAVGAVVTQDAFRRQQAVALLGGVAEGLEYVQQNEPTIRQGFAHAGHGMSAADMDRVHTAVHGVNFQAMKQNIQSLAAGNGLMPLEQPQAAQNVAPNTFQVAQASRQNVRQALFGSSRPQQAAGNANLAVEPAPEVPAVEDNQVAANDNVQEQNLDVQAEVAEKKQSEAELPEPGTVTKMRAKFEPKPAADPNQSQQSGVKIKG